MILSVEADPQANVKYLQGNLKFLNYHVKILHKIIPRGIFVSC